MSATSRRIVREPRFERDLQQVFAADARAAEAWADFERVLARMAEQGMAVPGRPGFRSWPFHTGGGSYLIIYSLTKEKIVCLTLRPVRSGLF